MTRWIAAACLLTLSLPALAGDKEEPKYVIKPVTEIEFEGANVEGKVQRPAIQLIDTHSGLPFKSLVRPRLDFKPEMRASVDEIK